jgi:hypothetical protein
MIVPLPLVICADQESFIVDLAQPLIMQTKNRPELYFKKCKYWGVASSWLPVPYHKRLYITTEVARQI